MIIIQLDNAINNTSLQVGDTAWYVDNVQEDSGVNNSQFSPIYIGEITTVFPSTVEVDNIIPLTFNPNTMFLMFSKDARANNTSLIGYYAEVTMTNDSGERAELFKLGSEVAPSSK